MKLCSVPSIPYAAPLKTPHSHRKLIESLELIDLHDEYRPGLSTRIAASACDPGNSTRLIGDCVASILGVRFSGLDSTHAR